MAFLNDLFEKLNCFNLSLQGAIENIITITAKLKAFTEKLQLWIRKAENSQLDCFPSVDAFPNKDKIMQEIQTTLKNLASSFAKYFPSLDTRQYEWVMNPFVNYEDTCLTMAEEENLIDLKNDLVYEASFAELELSAFWISL